MRALIYILLIDLRCKADASGTQRQICGLPDFSFSAELCTCLGDE